MSHRSAPLTSQQSDPISSLQREWKKLKTWVKVKGLKVILILEGDDTKTQERFLKKITAWSSKKRLHILTEGSVKHRPGQWYFQPIIDQLAQPGEIRVFDHCWYNKALREWQEAETVDHSFWTSFTDLEKMLQGSGHLIIKYCFRHRQTEKQEKDPLEVLKITDSEATPWYTIDCSGDKRDLNALLQHFLQQIPFQDLSFSQQSVNFDLLKKRAFNLRWATVEEGVIPLTAADPDFPAAIEIQDAIKAYTNGGFFPYGPAEGLLEFRQAASIVLQSRKGISCGPENILPVDGAASGMFTIANFALNPGEEAIIFDPVDFLFQKAVESAGGKVIRIPMDWRNGSFDFNQLEQSITEKTRMIGVCNPHNPLGRVLNKAELEFIGGLAIKHGLWILNDEIWSDIVYPPYQHLNIAAIHPEIAKRTISVYGFSKTFALAGLRVGFIAAPSNQVYTQLLQISKAKTTAAGVSTLSQIAATAAYQNCWYWADAFLDHLIKVRDYAVDRLNKIEGVQCKKPEGTYLLFPNIEAFGLSSQSMAKYLLQEAKVAVVPGAANFFGPGAEGHIRICYATSMEIIEEALNRIEKALNILREARANKIAKEAAQVLDRKTN